MRVLTPLQVGVWTPDTRAMALPTPVRDVLLTLLRAQEGTADQRITGALTALAEDLQLEVAFLGEFRHGQRVITHVGSRDGVGEVLLGLSHPASETLCHLIATGELAPLVPARPAPPSVPTPTASCSTSAPTPGSR